MPTALRRENTIIKRFLWGYENRSWSGAQIVPLDIQMERAVEVLATRDDGCTLAIEHTIIEPFKNDKQDFAWFAKSGFLSLEQDESLRSPGTWTRVFVPVGTLRGHRTPAEQQTLVRSLRNWIAENRGRLPRGESDHQCTARLPNGHTVTMTLHIEVVPLRQSSLHIRRQQVEDNLGDVIEKALNKKLPKLVNTPADKRILMLERQHMNLFPKRMLSEINKRKSMFPQLARVDEIWIVETMAYDTESILYFEHYHDDTVDGFMVDADGSVWP